VKTEATNVLHAGGQFFARGSGLKLCDSSRSAFCPLASLKDESEIVRDSDKVATV